jgi:hypothetical protein
MASLEEKVARIKELYEAEQAQPRKATKLGDLPSNYEAISPRSLLIVHIQTQ